jgi:protease-4
VTIDDAEAGWAALEEIRNEMLALRRAGKRVFAYMVSGSARDYLIATAADRIYVDPAGGLRVVGMATTTLYFRGVLDHLGVAPQVERIGEYKTAPEQLTETGPTAASVQMHDALLDSLWTRWVDAVASGRRLSPDRVRELVDHGPYTAGQLAGDHELVDGVGSPEKISNFITRELGAGYPVDAAPRERPPRWAAPGIAIIYIDGDITGGKSQSVPVLDATLTGSETIIDALQTARTDPRVAAIILRIDSPGGSAVGSELISREVFATRGVKPILCSFSNLAASGGYFAAAGCDLIFAEPMTITGSIGIFAGKLDLSGLLGKLGITLDTSKRGKRAGLDSWLRPFTDDERAALRDNLVYEYGRFVGAVAAGRSLTKDAVDEVGRGHVFTGEQALAVKLVDRFGGLGDAIDEAKHRAGLARDAEIRIFELPHVPTSVLGELGKLLGLDERAPQVLELTIARELLHAAPPSLLVEPDQPQARLPFTIVWPCAHCSEMNVPSPR